MSRLRAEKRRDRNGRMVTRWVKDAPAPAAPRGIPAPTQGPAARTLASIRWLVKQAADDAGDFPTPRHRESFESALARALGNFDASTIGMLRSAVRERRVEPCYVNTLAYDYREDEVRLMCVYSEAFDADSDWELKADLSTALPGYPAFEGAGDPALFKGSKHDEAAALLKVASAIAMKGQDSTGGSPALVRNRIADAELYRLIIEDPSRADALAHLVEARGTISGDLAAEWLGTSAPLRDGAL